MKKYELQPTYKTTPNGKPLFQVVALRDFGFVKKGDKGGYIESETNLSHEGNCWVSGNAQIFGNAKISDNAQIFVNAQIFGNAWVFDDAEVFDNARIFGNAWVFDDAEVSGNAQIFGEAWAHNNARIFRDTQITAGHAFAIKDNSWDITEVDNGNGTSTLYADAVFEPAEPECDVHDGSEVSAIREVCDHTDWTRGSYSDGIYVDMGYRYCPKCGEKL